MSDMNDTSHSYDENDADIPVLTDILDEEDVGLGQPKGVALTLAANTAMAAANMIAIPEVQVAASLPSLEQIETELSSRLTAELAVQIPVLLEAALREHLPRAMGAKLQAELLSALANALPGAAQNAAAELSSTLAFEVGGLLEQRLEGEVRRAVSDEIARISERSEDHQGPH